MEKRQTITITLRLPSELHKTLKERAEYLGISLNEFICYNLDKIANTFSEETPPSL